MKEKIQIKIINRTTLTDPQLETSINSIDNEKAKEIAGALSYENIKILIKKGVLVKNDDESKPDCEVYDLMY